MDQVEVEQKIRDILIEEFTADADDVTTGSHLVDDLGLGSLEMVQFGMDLEEEFGIEIPDSAISASMTVGDVAAEVRKLMETV
jgi:acyl carrier protein